MRQNLKTQTELKSAWYASKFKQKPQRGKFGKFVFYGINILIFQPQKILCVSVAFEISGKVWYTKIRVQEKHKPQFILKKYMLNRERVFWKLLWYSGTQIDWQPKFRVISFISQLQHSALYVFASSLALLAQIKFYLTDGCKR